MLASVSPQTVSAALSQQTTMKPGNILVPRGSTMTFLKT